MIGDDFYDLLENRDLYIIQNPIFYEIIRNTWVKTAYPQMLTHPYTAEFLFLLSKSKNIKKVLEIGTFTGFTTILFATSTDNDALIYTIEKHREYEELINEHIALANVQDKIKIFWGEALDVLSILNDKFDLISFDADKVNYPKYLELCIELLNKDGILAFDNVDWYGNIHNNAKDKKTKTIKEIKIKAEELQRINPTLLKEMTLPIGDGILLIQKLNF